jgi:hypothetical protein
MDVPIAVVADKFGIADILVLHQRFIFLGDDSRTPDTISSAHFGVVDGYLEPPVRENRIHFLFDGDTVVPKDDWLCGVLARIFVLANLACLLLRGRVEVYVRIRVLHSGLKLIVLVGE